MKTMFFSLNAAIWLHALPESILAKALKKSGHEITYVSCNQTFPDYCTSMSAFGLEPSSDDALKRNICKQCNKNAAQIAKVASNKHLNLSSYVTNEDVSEVKKLILQLTQDNYLDFEYMGVPVGRIATYEPYLKLKKMTTVLDDAQWKAYLQHIESCLISLLGFSKIYAQEHPTKIFIYSPQYGTNGVCAEYAIQHGSKVYFIEGSSSNSERYSALRVWSWGKHRLVNPALAHWDQVKQFVTKQDINRIHGHLSELYKASSFAVFSNAKKGNLNLRDHYKIPQDSKIILASLSSYDEAYSAFVIGAFPAKKVNSSVFRDQFIWIQNTIEYISKHENLFLIIRVHPRDYPNKRELIQSEQSKKWESILSNLPSNVVANMPNEGLSIYDILDQVNLVITGWSATGVEALIHGVPVVTYDFNLPSYPADIHFTGDNLQSYFANIQTALNDENKIQKVLHAFRWLAVSFSMGTVQLEQMTEIGKNWQPSLINKISKRLLNKIFKRLLMRIDLHKEFKSAEEEKRFLKFFETDADSLYDSGLIGNSPLTDDLLLADLTIDPDFRHIK